MVASAPKASPRQYWTVALLTMLVGGLLYVLWRSDSLFMFGWFRSLGAERIVAGLRAAARPYRNNVPDWAIYSLPQGLWCFSGLIALRAIWQRVPDSPGLYIWSVAFAVACFTLEWGQLLGMVPGQFDRVDLAFLAAASVTACYYGGL